VENYLDRFVKSMLDQTFKEFELVLVDDGSFDNSPQICDGYAKKDNRIKVIHKKTNEGLPRARETGFRESNGSYILFFDSDDWVEKTMLEEMYKLTIQNNYDMVCCGFFNPYGKKILFEKRQIDWSDKEVLFSELFSTSLYEFSMWNKLFKRNIIATIDFRCVSNNDEDYFLSLQAYYFAQNIGYINKLFYHYCYNPNSLSNDISKKVKVIFDSHNNHLMVEQFMREKFGDNLERFEPGLSKRSNELKNRMLANKDTRTLLKQSALFSSSYKYVFRNTKMHFINKILLIMAIKKIPGTYYIYDLFRSIKSAFKLMGQP
jgi:glycosyltransferase involved in cell wall biosynthesis